jgi:hypothetical protein
MVSYQNGGSPPRKLEEIGVSAETLQRRKWTRRLLFTFLFVFLVLSLVFMTVFVHISHQQEARGENTIVDYDDDDDSVGGDGRIQRSFDNSVISLDDLNLRTNTSVQSGCETTVVMVRHCEKMGVETVDKDGNEHCNYIGYERAHFLPSLFGTPGDTNGVRWPVPAALFALTPDRSDHYNFREVETLIPLANQYGLEIESDFPNNKHMSKRLFQGLSTGDWCGKAVVVSWRHEYLGDLAQKLGCVDCPDHYPDRIFDEVWQLKYVYDVRGTPIIQTSHMHPTTPTRPPLSSSSPNAHRLRRELMTKANKKTKDIPTMPDKKWSVYSTITHQNFDPLKFSFTVGDYGGGTMGGKWYEPIEGEEPSSGEM